MSGPARAEFFALTATAAACAGSLPAVGMALLGARCGAAAVRLPSAGHGGQHSKSTEGEIRSSVLCFCSFVFSCHLFTLGAFRELGRVRIEVDDKL